MAIRPFRTRSAPTNEQIKVLGVLSLMLTIRLKLDKKMSNDWKTQKKKIHCCSGERSVHFLKDCRYTVLRINSPLMIIQGRKFLWHIDVEGVDPGLMNVDHPGTFEAIPYCWTTYYRALLRACQKTARIICFLSDKEKQLWNVTRKVKARQDKQRCSKLRYSIYQRKSSTY